MKAIPALAVLAVATGTAHAAGSLTCYEMPNRNDACVQLGKVTSTPHANGTREVVAPFVILAPNRQALVEGHALEVACADETPLALALRDKNGTRYSEFEATTLSLPAHTRALANELCKAKPKAKGK